MAPKDSSALCLQFPSLWELRLYLQAVVTFLSQVHLANGFAKLWMYTAALASFSVSQSLTCQALLAEMVTLHHVGWSPEFAVDISVSLHDSKILTFCHLQNIACAMLRPTASVTHTCSLFAPSYLIRGRWAVCSRTSFWNKVFETSLHIGISMQAMGRGWLIPGKPPCILLPRIVCLILIVVIHYFPLDFIFKQIPLPEELNSFQVFLLSSLLWYPCKFVWM